MRLEPPSSWIVEAGEREGPRSAAIPHTQSSRELYKEGCWGFCPAWLTVLDVMVAGKNQFEGEPKE
jgi:hypothetical protein